MHNMSFEVIAMIMLQYKFLFFNTICFTYECFSKGEMEFLDKYISYKIPLQKGCTYFISHYWWV